MLGVLTAGRIEPDFTRRDEMLLATFANVGTVALERAHEAARAVTTCEGALLALGLVLEARDDETQGHTSRTVALAERLGGALVQQHVLTGEALIRRLPTLSPEVLTDPLAPRTLRRPGLPRWPAE